MQNFTRNPIKKAPGLEKAKNIFKNEKNCFAPRNFLKIGIQKLRNRPFSGPHFLLENFLLMVWGVPNKNNFWDDRCPEL